MQYQMNFGTYYMEKSGYHNLLLTLKKSIFSNLAEFIQIITFKKNNR